MPQFNEQVLQFELGKLHEGVSYDDYALQPGLRASDLHYLKRSPAHYKANRESGKKKTDALRFGSIFHLAIENGEKFLDTIMIEPEFVGKTLKGEDSKRSKEALLARKEWLAGVPKNRIAIKKNEAEAITGMLKAAMNHRLLRKLLKEGLRETSLWAEDPATGITLQCRPDFISTKGHIVDFKTTTDARKEFFFHEIFSTKGKTSPFYILSAAHYAYTASISKIPGLSGESFTFVAIEKDPPYGIMIYPMDIGCLGPGEQWRSCLTQLYADCKNADKWPCYEERAVNLTPPDWVELPPSGDDI